ncbi:MAG: precorrin-6A reductase [Syntrophomonadaceae bacterium]|nr:precorrin-6A reductase [Syntrophomonadaceae bacterium]
MSEILIFAGTTEGRKLLEAILPEIDEWKLSISVCVATDYGKYLLPADTAKFKVLSGRLDEGEMIRLMTAYQYDYVIDATHPYAIAASENIRSACVQAGCNYIRLLRDSGTGEQGDTNTSFEKSEEKRWLFFKSHEAVISYLNQTTGNVLLTIGSKELEKYTSVLNYQPRLFARVLPTVEALQKCIDLGFPGRHVLCMQGPFSAEFNTALINQVKAKYLVTKDSGRIGGFWEKYKAALSTGTILLVVGRKMDEEGSCLEEVLDFLKSKYGIRRMAEAIN